MFRVSGHYDHVLYCSSSSAFVLRWLWSWQDVKILLPTLQPPWSAWCGHVVGSVWLVCARLLQVVPQKSIFRLLRDWQCCTVYSCSETDSVVLCIPTVRLTVLYCVFLLRDWQCCTVYFFCETNNVVLWETENVLWEMDSCTVYSSCERLTMLYYVFLLCTVTVLYCERLTILYCVFLVWEAVLYCVFLLWDWQCWIVRDWQCCTSRLTVLFFERLTKCYTLRDW